MIYIRADANERIATGHIMRCLSVAEAVRDLNKEVCFLVADDKGKELVEQRGFPCIVLNSRWDQVEQELPSVINLLQKYPAEGILVDSYYVTEKYLLSLRQYTKVIYIDDLNTFPYPCDVLVNYAVYADDLAYWKFDQNVKFLFGCRYVPLRKEFANTLPKQIKKTAENVLVLTGGSDTLHFVVNFVETVKKKVQSIENTIKFHIVCGRYNPDIDELRKMCKGYGNLILHSYVNGMYELMEAADIAISAGGSTLYELCACGTPTITYAMADNQLRNVHKFHEMGLMHYSGDIRKSEYRFEKLLDEIICLANNQKKRCQISGKIQMLVDGNGASRIAQILLHG